MLNRKKSCSYQLSNTSTAEGIIFQKVEFNGLPSTHFNFDSQAERFVLDGKTFSDAKNTIVQLKQALEKQNIIIYQQQEQIESLEPFKHKTPEEQYLKQIFNLTQIQKQMELDKKAYLDQSNIMRQQINLQTEQIKQLTSSIQDELQKNQKMIQQLDKIEKINQVGCQNYQSQIEKNIQQIHQLTQSNQENIKKYEKEIITKNEAISMYKDMVEQRNYKILIQTNENLRLAEQISELQETISINEIRVNNSKQFQNTIKNSSNRMRRFQTQISSFKNDVLDVQSQIHQIIKLNKYFTETTALIGTQLMQLSIKTQSERKIQISDNEDQYSQYQSKINKLNQQIETQKQQLIITKTDLKLKNSNLELAEFEIEKLKKRLSSVE